jgi:hypothetical protein
MEKRLYVKEGREDTIKKTIIIALFIIILIIVVILVGLYLVGAKAKEKEKSTQLPPLPTPTKSIFPTQAPPASPSASLTVFPSTILSQDPAESKRTELKIAVLNGSGKIGAATLISSYLSSLGYNIVSVSNANSYNYHNITLLVSPAKSKYTQLLKKDLEEKSATVSASISDEISTDAQVIVGK